MWTWWPPTGIFVNKVMKTEQFKHKLGFWAMVLPKMAGEVIPLRESGRAEICLAVDDRPCGTDPALLKICLMNSGAGEQHDENSHMALAFLGDIFNFLFRTKEFEILAIIQKWVRSL